MIKKSPYIDNYLYLSAHWVNVFVLNFFINIFEMQFIWIYLYFSIFIRNYKIILNAF